MRFYYLFINKIQEIQITLFEITHNSKNQLNDANKTSTCPTFFALNRNAKFSVILRENTLTCLFADFFFHDKKYCVLLRIFVFMILEIFGRKMDENGYFPASFSFCFETCFFKIPRYALLLCQDFFYIL